MVPAGVEIRRATTADGPGAGEVWLGAWYATFDFPPSHPDDDVRRWIRDELIATTEAYVAIDSAGEIVALMALSDHMVEQLYVIPHWIGRGLGSRLLDLAKSRRPSGLDLYCFQVNSRARRFYEARGFETVALGDGTNNSEHQPDIRYAWRP